MLRSIVSLVIGVLFLSPTYAAVQSGTLEEQAVAPKPALSIDLFGWSYTNAFAKWNGRTPKADGTSGDPMQIVTQITAHTPAFGVFDFEVTPQFILQPTEGQRFQLLDPTVGFQGVVVESGGFSYWARYEAALPFVEKSHRDGVIVIPQAINALAYVFPRTKLKAELVLIPSITVKNTGTSGSLYVSPRLYYLVSDSFWLMSIAQFGYDSKKGPFNYYTTGPASVGVGARFLAGQGRGLWVQPFANFYANENAATTAHMGVNFGGPLL